VPFLEQLVVGDIAGIPNGSGSLSMFTNEKGGIIDDTVVTKVRCKRDDPGTSQHGRSSKLAVAAEWALGPDQSWKKLPVAVMSAIVTHRWRMMKSTSW
jgi:glycine cleavage system aminomethyltransferase T